MVNLYQKRDNLDLTLKYDAKALEILIASYREKHTKVGDTLENVGLVHESKGDYSAALPLFEETLCIRLHFLGEIHIQTQMIKRFIARTLLQNLVR